MSRENRPIKFWEEFRVAIYHDEVLPLEQERECSMAFYAGMLSAFNELSAIAGRAKSDDSGAYELEILRQEINHAAMQANQQRETN
jgi:hypothetical protein